MPYLLLVAFAVAVAYLGYRLGHPPIFVAAVTGMAASLGISDFVTAGLLRLYIFRPHLAPTVSQDHPLGFLLADFIAVPLLYVGVAALFPRSRMLVALGLAGLLALIEYGFVQAGVFVHQAWSTWFTLILFTLRLLVAAWWVPLLERVGYTPAFRAFLILMGVNVAWYAWTIPVSSILRVWIIRPGLLAVQDSDRVLGMGLYHGLPFVAVGGLAVWLGWGRTAGGLLLTAAIMTAYLLWLDGSGLWHRTAGWNPLLEGVVLTILVVAVAHLDRWWEARIPPRVHA